MFTGVLLVSGYYVFRDLPDIEYEVVVPIGAEEVAVHFNGGRNFDVLGVFMDVRSREDLISRSVMDEWEWSASCALYAEGAVRSRGRELIVALPSTSKSVWKSAIPRDEMDGLRGLGFRDVARVQLCHADGNILGSTPLKEVRISWEGELLERCSELGLELVVTVFASNIY